jgi:hypothetical protein
MTAVRTLAPILLAACLSGLAAGSARADAIQDRPPEASGLRGLAVSLDMYGLVRLDEGREHWDDEEDGLGAVGLEVGYDLLEIGPATRLALAVGWFGEDQVSSRSTAVDRTVVSGQWQPAAHLNAALKTRTLEAAALLRFRTDRALQPYFRLGLAGSRSQLTFDRYQSNGLEATAYGASARASLGIRVQPRALTLKPTGRARPVLGLALGAEIGGQAGTPFSFELHRPSARPETAAGSAERIPVEPVPLGKLGRMAGYGRVSVIAIF